MDVSTMTHKDIGKLLQEVQGSIEMVVGRPLLLESVDELGVASDPSEVGSPSGMVIARFKKLNASLGSKLDTKSREVEDHRTENEKLVFFLSSFSFSLFPKLRNA